MMPNGRGQSSERRQLSDLLAMMSALGLSPNNPPRGVGYVTRGGNREVVGRPYDWQAAENKRDFFSAMTPLALREGVRDKQEEGLQGEVAAENLGMLKKFLGGQATLGEYKRFIAESEPRLWQKARSRYEWWNQ